MIEGELEEYSEPSESTEKPGEGRVTGKRAVSSKERERLAGGLSWEEEDLLHEEGRKRRR
jgi:hypothetical protein